MADRVELAARDAKREMPCDPKHGCAHGYCHCPDHIRQDRAHRFTSKLKGIVREQEKRIKSLVDECRALADTGEDQDIEMDALRTKLEETERALCLAKRDIKVSHVEGIRKGLGV